MLCDIQLLTCFWPNKLWNKTQDGTFLLHTLFCCNSTEMCAKWEKREEFCSFEIYRQILHLWKYALGWIKPLVRVFIETHEILFSLLFFQILQVKTLKMVTVHLQLGARCLENTFPSPWQQCDAVFPVPRLWLVHMVSLPNSWHWKWGGRGHTITCW